MSSKSISIHGARTHNLKNVSVELPHQQLTVITGPSGSGKSSLAFNTLYAEGQRRFVESMSTYIRQFLERMERPDVDSIDGILPALAIEQKNSVKNARSTVATATELADYMRLFMTYCGESFCPRCNAVVRKETAQSVSALVNAKLSGRRVIVTTPVAISEETTAIVLTQLLKAGFYRVWHDGGVRDLKELDTSGLETLEIITGRLKVADSAALLDCVEQAFSLSRQHVNVQEETDQGWRVHRFTAGFNCNACGVELNEPRPHLFSFNSPLGACESCQGYGRVIGIDIDKVIPNRSLPLNARPIAPWNSPGYEDSYDDLQKAAKKNGLRLDVPIEQLTEAEWDVLYSGRGKWYGIKGFFDWLETKKYKIHVRVKLAKYRSYTTCHDCQGTRLKPEALQVRFREMTIADLFAMNVGTARRFWEYLPLTKQEEEIAGHLRRDILNRLVYLDEVGLSYLTLDRQTRTLSGGESQRINLAAALGSGLTATMYVIDEPTVGLHARDSERLLHVLGRLRDQGNTVIVVEHDPTIIGGADHIVRLGPGAGELGGELIYSGPAGGYREPAIAAQTRDESLDPKSSGFVSIIGAREHNLKNIDVHIPLNRLVALTGVSGSGKSTLLRNCLFNAYRRQVHSVSNVDVGACDRLEGLENVDEIEFVDQTPIGRSTRSNPATYVKAWDDIRKLLSETTSAKVNGVTPGMFSFNTTGGRCEPCEGTGLVLIDMQFLADVEVVCDQCGGKRFTDKVLKVNYKGANVDRILSLTVDEAVKFFIDKRQIVRKLDALRAVGLGYLRLGQSTASLSGGEAQRLKLASFLVAGERDRTRRLFLFDEPTTGLHSSDVAQLIRTFRDLISRGHSVVVIEHNLQLVDASDYIIDLGPEGGDGGGELVACGTVDEVAASERSLTGRELAKSRRLTQVA